MCRACVHRAIVAVKPCSTGYSLGCPLQTAYSRLYAARKLVLAEMKRLVGEEEIEA